VKICFVNPTRLQCPIYVVAKLLADRGHTVTVVQPAGMIHRDPNWENVPLITLPCRYETLLQQPQATLETILTFLEVSFPPDLMSRVPELRISNSGRWQQAWSSEEKTLVGPILGPMLVRLGYAQDDSWYAR